MGAECPVDYLNVWFPARWAPLVFQALQQKGDDYRAKNPMWFDAPAQVTDTIKLVRERAEALQSELHFQAGKMDPEGDIPTLIGNLKVDWIDLPAEDITKQFGALKEGILRGVFREKAAAAWFGFRAEIAQITVILPGELEADAWLETIDRMSHGSPKSTTVGRFQVDDLLPRTFHLYRKFTRARHLWLSLRPDCGLIKTHMYTVINLAITRMHSYSTTYSITLAAMTLLMTSLIKGDFGTMHITIGSLNGCSCPSFYKLVLVTYQ